MKKLLILLLLPLTTIGQVDWCDSISYSVLPNTNGVFSVMIETTDSLDNYCDTVSVAWAVCNFQLCFLGNGTFASFPIIQNTDTVKVCYSAYVTDTNCTEWVEWSNVLGWEEILPNGQHKGVVYDLKGRVVTDVKKNRIYIKNMKKFIKF